MVKQKKLLQTLLFLFLGISADASVRATVEPKRVELGESVTYSLHISGKDVTRPNITKLCDSDIISTNSQTNMQIINGVLNQSFTISYRFVPQKSCKIAPVEVEVDDKLESSNEVEVEVVPQSMTKESDFMLELSAQKKELFVGEMLEVTLEFKQRRDAEALDSKFTPPDFSGFWVKSESKPQREEEGKFVTTKITYTLLPQRTGDITLTKAQMQIASRSSSADSWGAWIPTIKWKTYFSNELSFHVKPLPEGLNLVGDFKISATADKIEAEANEAVNVTIEVEGSGNLEDIKSFKPSMPQVGVFDEKIFIEGSKLTQKIAFVSDGDFTIPSFSLRYFDTKTKEIKSIQTKEIAVKIKNAKPKESLNIQRDSSQEPQHKESVETKNSVAMLFLSFVLGALSTIAALFFTKRVRLKKEPKISLKDPKTLLMKLLPFKEEKDVKEIIDILEKNIYENKNIEIDKKALKEVLSRHIL